MKLSSLFLFTTCLSLLIGIASDGSAQTLPGKANSKANSQPFVQSKFVKVDFDHDVRPILSENCFACHGPDSNKRQAGLRLDLQEGAYAKLPSGRSAVVPGNPAASEIVGRIVAHDDLQMPPQSSGKTLKPAQINTLRRWIMEGGHYAPHWAFVPPQRPILPLIRNVTWVHNSIDRFIMERLEKEGLTPSPEADRRTLIRRVSFDLTGLPPTVAEVNEFVADKRPDAYERLVDRLLASPHYGERMALAWLDLARYADTHGYHIDSQRDMWRWRDWVIDAYNHNLPYDQFTIQQLAGDLLPNATLDQKIATGFNRNHPIDFEGGAIPEEYAAAYIFDRIDTTATTFMGLTMRCCQCHDHKYDPITQKEYYNFYAFFNNVPELGLDGQKGNAVPYIKAPTPEQTQQLAALDKSAKDLDLALKTRADSLKAQEAAWEREAAAKPDQAVRPPAGLVARFKLDEMSGNQIHDSSAKLATYAVQGKAAWGQGKLGGALSLDGASYVDVGDAYSFDRMDKVSYGAWIYPTSGEAMTVISRMDDADAIKGWDIFLVDRRIYVHMIHAWDKNAMRVGAKMQLDPGKWHHVFVTYDGSSKAKGIKLYIDGKLAEVDITHDSLTDTIRTTKPVLIGKRSTSGPFKGMIQDVRIYNRELAPEEVAQIAGMDTIKTLLTTAAEKRTPEQKTALVNYYLTNFDETYKKLSADAADAHKKLADLDSAIPTTMVMQEMDKPRDTFLLIRGQYDKKGEKVTPGVPSVLPPLPEGMPANRLALAKWLVSPTHPLTARVAVNRYWQMLFGMGLVKTAENFGTQGETPSHPELLDWLATEYIRTGWDTKAMMRMLVTSATYRQASAMNPRLLERDPENRLLARGPRFRLPAEMIRDQALALSGLLVDKQGGPSVHPYQPPGLWEEIAFGGGFSAQTYVQDHGDALYRRSMYTFWKRTVPPPALQTFDAPEREFCMVRRSVTNTPLQALILMNDPTYVETSRKFAERIMKEKRTNTLDRIEYAFRIATARSPKPAETRVLQEIYNERLAAFTADRASAEKLLSVGESKRDDKLDIPELAAWTAVSSVILNLDETITKS